MPRPIPLTVRGAPGPVKTALCARDSECPSCGGPVEENEPITLHGVSFVEGPRPRKVDLSDAEWWCQRCP